MPWLGPLYILTHICVRSSGFKTEIQWTVLKNRATYKYLNKIDKWFLVSLQT